MSKMETEIHKIKISLKFFEDFLLIQDLMKTVLLHCLAIAKKYHFETIAESVKLNHVKRGVNELWRILRLWNLRVPV